MDIEMHKLKLQQEIEIAEANLKHNVGEINVFNYLTPSATTWSIANQFAFQSPTDTIRTLDSAASFVLPEDSSIRQILKYVGMGLNLYQNLK